MMTLMTAATKIVIYILSLGAPRLQRTLTTYTIKKQNHKNKPVSLLVLL